MQKRILNLAELVKWRSLFLFGPRATGKTTLVQTQLPNALVIDLLENQTYRDLLARPALIGELAKNPSQIIVIDEIQKLPILLDEVHRLIQKKNLRFLLTGSSARKLKRGAANLLAGRAWTAHLFPFCSAEVPNFNLEHYVNSGGLPDVYLGSNADEDLRAYIANYLREEIQAEALSRNIQAFSEFLDIIGLTNGQEINYESLSSDCQVSPSTIKGYIDVLEDTLIGFRVPAFTKTRKRKAISRAKFFLFDLGVARMLAKRSKISIGSEEFGKALEHFIALELRAYLSYRRLDNELCYWRSTSKMEVDIVVAPHFALEVKASNLVQDKHTKGLRAFMEEGLVKNYYIVSNDSRSRTLDNGIKVFPWQEFLKALWSDRIIVN